MSYPYVYLPNHTTEQANTLLLLNDALENFDQAIKTDSPRKVKELTQIIKTLMLDFNQLLLDEMYKKVAAHAKEMKNQLDELGKYPNE